jgi:hypothetical protein
MAYKTQFRPLERLGRDGWRRMDQVGIEPALDDVVVRLEAAGFRVERASLD